MTKVEIRIGFLSAFMHKGFFASDKFSRDSRGRRFREIQIPDRTGQYLQLKMEGSIIPKGKTKEHRLHFKVGRVVWGQQSNDKDKVALIEELLWDDGRTELRLGYRTTTHEKGMWWWGESALMFPIEDLQELLELAVENGMMTLGNSPSK